MAGAFASSSDDALATYYNPGGLAYVSGTDVALMHVNWLPGLYPGMYYEYLGAAREFKGKGTAGLNIIYLTTGKTDVVDGNGNFLGTYTTFDFSVGGSYGFKVAPNLGAGVGAKFIYSFLVPDWVFKAMPELGIDAGGTGTSWALDAGVLYRPWNWLWVGASVSNLGPNISYVRSGESDPLPRTLRVGVRYSPVNTGTFRVSLLPEIQKILVGMFYDPDNTKTFGQKLSYEWYESWKSLGIELSYAQLVNLRLGYFEDITGARGGITVDRGDGLTDHISITDFLFKKNQGKFKSLGLTFGGGLEVRNLNLSFVTLKRLGLDISFDHMIYDFQTQNMKLSLSTNF
jgi:hypothetical protein